MKKEYTRPEVIITSYEAENSIMLVSGLTQRKSNMTTNNYSAINF